MYNIRIENVKILNTMIITISTSTIFGIFLLFAKADELTADIKSNLLWPSSISGIILFLYLVYFIIETIYHQLFEKKYKAHYDRLKGNIKKDSNIKELTTTQIEDFDKRVQDLGNGMQEEYSKRNTFKYKAIPYFIYFLFGALIISFQCIIYNT